MDRVPTGRSISQGDSMRRLATSVFGHDTYQRSAEFLRSAMIPGCQRRLIRSAGASASTRRQGASQTAPRVYGVVTRRQDRQGRKPERLRVGAGETGSPSPGFPRRGVPPADDPCGDEGRGSSWFHPVVFRVADINEFEAHDATKAVFPRYRLADREAEQT